jgi:LssY C-terminus
MTDDPSSPMIVSEVPARRTRVRAIFWAPLVILSAYWLVSYLAVPNLWRSYERRHPALEDAQRRAFTSLGIPGDPINIAFVGNEEELVTAVIGAGWIPADPITWGTSAKIAIDAVIRRAYPSAPVSDLFVWKKKQDMAFEQPFGPDPRRRHHVRFWRSELLDDQGRPLWLGAATFDSRVGVSHMTGQVTHHIDADVDKERDKLAADLSKNPKLALEWVDDFQTEKTGRNGGGDPFFTDGRLCVARPAGP